MHSHEWTFLHSHFVKCDICGKIHDMRTKQTRSDRALITLAVAAIGSLVVTYSDEIIIMIREMI